MPSPRGDRSAGTPARTIRALAALLVIGVLADASACVVAFPRVEPQPEQTTMSMLCPCGCKAHTGAPSGIGLSQLAAAPAEIEPPAAPPRAAPWRTAPGDAPEAPARGIDHVPILVG